MFPKLSLAAVAIAINLITPARALDRAGLLASVGIALESAEQAGRAVNQVSLFGEGDDPMEQSSLINVPS